MSDTTSNSNLNENEIPPDDDLDLDLHLTDEDLDAEDEPPEATPDAPPDDDLELGSFEDIDVAPEAIVSASSTIKVTSERTLKKKRERDMLLDFMLQPKDVLERMAGGIKAEADALRLVAAQRKRVERAASREMERDQASAMERDAEEGLEMDLEGPDADAPEPEQEAGGTLEDYIRPSYVPDSSVLTEEGRAAVNRDFEAPIFMPLVKEDNSTELFGIFSNSESNKIRRSVKTLANISPTYGILEKSDLLLGNRIYDRIGILIQRSDSADDKLASLKSYIEASPHQSLSDISFECGWQTQMKAKSVKVCVTDDRTYILVTKSGFSSSFDSRMETDIALAFEGGMGMLKEAIKSKKPLISNTNLQQEAEDTINYICDTHKREIINRARGIRGYQSANSAENRDMQDVENILLDRIRQEGNALNEGQVDTLPYRRAVPVLEQNIQQIEDENLLNRRVSNPAMNPSVLLEGQKVRMSRTGIVVSYSQEEATVVSHNGLEITRPKNEMDIELTRLQGNRRNGYKQEFSIDKATYREGENTVEMGVDSLNAICLICDNQTEMEKVNLIKRFCSALCSKAIEITQYLQHPPEEETLTEKRNIFDSLSYTIDTLPSTDWDSIKINGLPIVDRTTINMVKSRLNDEIQIEETRQRRLENERGHNPDNQPQI